MKGASGKSKSLFSCSDGIIQKQFRHHRLRKILFLSVMTFGIILLIGFAASFGSYF